MLGPEDKLECREFLPKWGPNGRSVPLGVHVLPLPSYLSSLFFSFFFKIYLF